MPKPTEPLTVPSPGISEETRTRDQLGPVFHVICWNDPVNLMVYVTHVFRQVFGWDEARAKRHMLEVHERGRSVLVREGPEKAEFYVHQLQQYRLQATMEPAE